MYLSARIALSAATLAAMTLGSVAQPLKISTNASPTHWLSVEGINPFIECVESATQKQITFQYYPSSQLASMTETIDALNNGLADIAYISIVAYSDRLPINGIAQLPGMGSTAKQATVAMRKVLDQDGPFLQEFINNQMQPLFVSMTTPYQVLSRQKAFESVESYKNAKIRTSGGVLTLSLKALGAAPVELPPGDIYVAIQQGTVDAAVLSMPSFNSYKLQEQAKWISVNAPLGNTASVVAMDANKWKNLTPEQQSAFASCSEIVENHLAEYFDASNLRWIEEFASEGIAMHEYTEEELKELAAALGKVTEEYISRLNNRGLPASDALSIYEKALP